MLSAKLTARLSPPSRTVSSRTVRVSAKAKKASPAPAKERDPEFISSLRVAVVVAAVAAGELLTYMGGDRMVPNNLMHTGTSCGVNHSKLAE